MEENPLLQDFFAFLTPPSISVVLTLMICAVLATVAATFSADDDVSNLPLVNGKKWWQLTAAKQKENYCNHAKEIIDEAFEKLGSAVRLQTDNGVELLLSADYANGVGNNESLDFGATVQEDFHANTPGFEPFRQGSFSDRVFHNAIKENMTKDLAKLNIPLSEETEVALRTHFTDQTDWHEVDLKTSIFKIVSQLSSRIFLGEELCRNENWLQITVEYTKDSMIAAQDLRQWPKLLRPYIHWFLPSCKIVRQELKRSSDLVNPILERRRKEKIQRIEQGLAPKLYLDAMEWMEQSASGRQYDPVVSQIMMAIAANFSGSDSLSTVILFLCEQPKLVEDMRHEIITVMTECKWDKSTIYKLRLMDSVLKESQRMKPAAVAVMRRLAMKTTKLHDGTVLRKGTKLMIATHKSWDSRVYPNADKFDGSRFLRIRDRGQENAQFVSTGPESLGFGHGKHSCPGRFFAANELKIALTHFLLKYDFKLVPDGRYEPQFQGLFWYVNDAAKIAIRRRQEEIQL